MPRPPDRKPPNYLDKRCADCGAWFTPTSGRQRFCEFHRGEKFVTARKTAAKYEQRHGEPRWRPPARLTVEGKHHRDERKASVKKALKLARRLHARGQEDLARELVALAERTAAGTFQLLGCHALGDLLVEYEGGGRAPRRDKTETLAEAEEFDELKAHFLAAGLCHRCAAQAAYGTQLGLGRVQPPCPTCVSPFASVALGVAKANGDMVATR